MKIKLYYSIVLLGLTGLGLNLQGQTDGDMPPPPPSDDIPEIDLGDLDDLKNQLSELRQQLNASRDLILDSLPEDFSIEDKMAALEEWKIENAADIELIAELQETFKDVMKSLRSDMPRFGQGGPFAEAREELQEARQALNESRRAIVEALGVDATQEEISAAVEAWKLDNQDAINELKETARELHETFKANRPDRPDFSRGPEQKALMAARRAEFKATADAIRAVREAAKTIESNPNLTEEERESLLAELREENRELVRDLKNLKRQKRQGGDDLGGERRPGG